MKPEDRARLDAAIEHAETIVGSTHNIYEMRWIRGIIDEQDAEIARLKTQSENQARIIDTQRRLAQCGESKFEAENETLKEQRAEERAKREAVEIRADLNVVMLEQKARADKAERELAEERAAHAKADAARANLRDKLDRLAAHSNGVADEVERWCVVAANWEGRAGKAEARVAELQALVDAGDTFRFGRFRVFPQYIAERGYRVEDEHSDWLAFDVPKQEAIALARDLAAKEKESTQ